MKLTYIAVLHADDARDAAWAAWLAGVPMTWLEWEA